MTAIAKTTDQIVDLDIERDRKTCVALDLKATGANRELAQWLLSHPYYTALVVADWLSCHPVRITRLRRWAKDGFIEPSHQSRYAAKKSSSTNQPLESLDNSDPDGQEAEIGSSEVADPATIEDNALYTIQRINEHARVFKKLFKVSSLDRETRDRIITAIERMIQKWRSTQATLERKGNDDGEE